MSRSTVTYKAILAGILVLGAVVTALMHVALHRDAMTSDERWVILGFVFGALCFAIPGLAKRATDRFAPREPRQP